MSELIDNSRLRREQLKSLIQKLHDGASVESVRQEFAEHFENVSATEISQLEQELVADGLPVMDIQKLCDVHASVFKGSIAEIHQQQNPIDIPGHPIHVFHQENDHIDKLLTSAFETDNKDELNAAVEKLWEIDKHYSRKENLLFPYLERYGVTAPPKVMWGVDDEIRALIKQLRHALANQEQMTVSRQSIAHIFEPLREKVQEMIFKEEKILFPMALEKLKNDDWAVIAAESAEIGFCLINHSSIPIWPAGAGSSKSTQPVVETGRHEPFESGRVQLPSGAFKVDELTGMLNTLPFDITFVDAEDTVRYFSQGQERIFARTQAIIGRKVVHCHPPASVGIVEKIVTDFKTGKRDHADFWIRMGERFALIRYFAVRSEQGDYLGTVEVTQDIAPIQLIEGEKRLLDD